MTSAANSSTGGTGTNNSTSTPNENNNTLTDDKLNKQNVKYDLSTGKVYEELGPCGTARGHDQVNLLAPTSTRAHPLDYNSYGQQSYTAATSYPYGNYMSSFGAHYGSAATASYPYDRTSMYSTYGAVGPKAFVPHSAINLSVKTPELPADSAVGGTASAASLDLSMTEQGTGAQSAAFSTYSQSAAAATGSSPQILDLTRQEAKKEIITSGGATSGTGKQEQTEPVDFSSQTSAYTYTTTSASSFSTTESGHSSTTDSLNRYRSNPVPGTLILLFNARITDVLKAIIALICSALFMIQYVHGT